MILAEEVNKSLWIADDTGENLRKISSDEIEKERGINMSYGNEASISPDGTKLLYGTYEGSLRIVNLLNDKDTLFKKVDYSGFRWLGDNHIIYGVNPKENLETSLASFDIIDIDTGETKTIFRKPVRITYPLEPGGPEKEEFVAGGFDVSFDGTKIVYAAGDSIYLLDTKNYSDRLLTQDRLPIPGGGPGNRNIFSWNSKLILFQRGDSYFTINVDDLKIRPVDVSDVVKKDEWFDLTWIPQSERLFLTVAPKGQDIDPMDIRYYTCNSDGTSKQRVFQFPDKAYVNIVLAPGGERVVALVITDSQVARTVVAHFDGTKETPLTWLPEDVRLDIVRWQ